MTQDPKWLSDIRERVGKATPGPWRKPNNKIPYVYGNGGPDSYLIHQMPIGKEAKGHIQETKDTWNIDAEFIAHSRTDIPTLLSVIDRYREALREVRNSIGFHREVPGGFWATCQTTYPLTDYLDKAINFNPMEKE